MKRKPVTIEQDSYGNWWCKLFWYCEKNAGDMPTEAAARAYALKWVETYIKRLEMAKKELEGT